MADLQALLRLTAVVLLGSACSWQEPTSSAPGRQTGAVQPVQPVQTAKPVRVEAKSASRRTAGAEALGVALQQLGRPYRYGGADPSGFDCSGLVQYAYSRVGVQTPRTTATLWRNLPRIDFADAQPGDLLFFRIDGKLAHVGLYAGDSEFVHAPSSGKTVSRASLTSRYYQSRLVGVARVTK